MDYILALKLQSAGFISTGDAKYISDGKGNYVTQPLLSELIEACGDKFKNLHRGENHWAVNVGTSEHQEGRIPEEAVANLWLELNKKS